MDQEIENYFKKVSVFFGQVAGIRGDQHDIHLQKK